MATKNVMRRLVLAFAALSVAGCKCGPKTATLSPQLLVLQETTDDPRTNVDFGLVQVGLKGTQNVRIRNGGTATLTLNSFTTTQTLFGVDTTLPADIDPSQELELVTTFSPVTADLHVTGTLTLSTNDSDAMTYDLMMGGQGVTAVATATPNPLALGDVYVGESAATKLTVTNAGGDDLPITLAKVTGSPDGVTADFSALTGQTIPAGGSVSVMVDVRADGAWRYHRGRGDRHRRDARRQPHRAVDGARFAGAADDVLQVRRHGRRDVHDADEHEPQRRLRPALRQPRVRDGPECLHGDDGSALGSADVQEQRQRRGEVLGALQAVPLRLAAVLARCRRADVGLRVQQHRGARWGAADGFHDADVVSAERGDGPDAMADGSHRDHVSGVVAVPERLVGSGADRLATAGPGEHPHAEHAAHDADGRLAPAVGEGQAGEHRSAESACLGALRESARRSSW